MGRLDENIEKEIQIAWKGRVKDLKLSFNQGLKILLKSEEIGYEKGIAGACKILGYCYWRFSDYAKSLEYSLRAINLYESLGDKAGLADSLNNLGAVYMFQNDHENRLKCNLKCLEIREEIGAFNEIAGSYNNIGETYLEMGDVDNAIHWLNKVLDYEKRDVLNVSWANFNLGKIFLLEKKIEKAVSFFKKALEVSLSVNYEVLIIESYLELANIYLAKSSNQEALFYVQKARASADKIGSKEYLSRAYLILSEIYEKQEDLKKALSVFKKYHDIHTALFNEKKAEEIKDINYHYELNKLSDEAKFERKKSLDLKKAYDKIEAQNNLIELKNKEFIDSVNYAKQIQKAFLAERKVLENKGFESFLIFEPKDIVSGDFYWSGGFGDYIYVVVGDCTGHGVPGGFLTMLGIAYLNEIVTSSTLPSPSEILTELRFKIIKDISRDRMHRDGMDVSIVKINVVNREVEWAGAKNPLWIVRKETNLIDILTGSKQSVCYNENLEPFIDHTIRLSAGDLIYLFTDGYCDQFGGERNKKFGRKRFKKALLKYKNRPMVEQKSHLVYEYQNWKGKEEQVDDICVVGIKF